MRWVTGASLKSVIGRVHNGRGTIRICKDRNILKEYLMRREVEVITIMMSLFDNEQNMKTYWKDMENTLSDEIVHQKDRETAERLIKKGKCHWKILQIVLRVCLLMN